MVIGYHLILTTYGFWLPNDPRGSWSSFVGSDELFRVAGRATKTDEPRSVAGRSHDRALRIQAKRHLARPPVRLDGPQALTIARGFASFLRWDGAAAWACAVLPDHAHLVLARAERPIEETARRLKAAATKRLAAEGMHPLAGFATASGKLPKPWTRGEWKVFLDSPDDVRRAVRYVEDNPVKAGMPRQRWSFVVPYEPEGRASTLASLPDGRG